MTLKEFQASLAQGTMPAGLTVPLQALWLAGNHRWHEAHDVLQHQPDDNGSAWVHAYLHREEGDLANAQYWYRRAQKPATDISLQAEWQAIAAALLAGQG